MNTKDASGPAFPQLDAYVNANGEKPVYVSDQGMTLRQYAAIKLKVPDSGLDWLNEMINKSRRDEFAAKAIICWHQIEGTTFKTDAEQAYKVADAMLEASK